MPPPSIAAFLSVGLMYLASCTPSQKATETDPTPNLNLAPSQYRASVAKPTTDSFRIGFYNVENLFDTIDTPNKDDAEFLPNGKMQWNGERYATKLRHIEEVMVAMNFPTVLGFCEVENRAVLEDLLKQPKLQNQGYAVAHFESPDERGIDVGMVYKSTIFAVKNAKSHKIDLGGDKTRDILEVSGTINGQNIHVFVNHWPSRRGGQAASDDKRMAAAKTVRMAVDSIQRIVKNPYIVIMGDLNDEPFDKSIAEGLGAKDPSIYERFLTKNLYNMSAPLKKRKEGTHYYQKEYSMLDQIVVSGNFLQTKSKLKASYEESVLRAPFLFFTDKKTGDSFPNRTYTGEKYRGGYSDHLPVYLTIFK